MNRFDLHSEIANDFFSNCPSFHHAIEIAPGPIAQTRGVGFNNRGALQFDRLHLSNEPCGIVAHVQSDYVEYSVTQAADIQDVVTLGSLRRTAWLDVDANQSFLQLLAPTNA